MDNHVIRNVEGWMGDDLYRKLGNEPNIEVTWKLIRELIGQHLFGTEFVTVPHIESAIYYNQLFVFIKENSLWSKFGIRPPTYKTVGNLDYLVDREASTWIPQFDFSPWDVVDGLSMNREYRLRIISNGIGLEKYIQFSLMDAHVRSAQAPTPGSLKIHTNMLQDLKGVKFLYVITDVVFASYVKLIVRIGNRNRTKVYDTETPVGFKYRKFKIRSDGRFVSEKFTTLRVAEGAAQWLRPIPQPVPTNPDLMRRRKRGNKCIKRKMRSSLTIPTPEEQGRMRNRRAFVEGGGFVPVGGHFNGGQAIDILSDDNADDQDDEIINILQQGAVQQNQDNSNRRSTSLINVVPN